MSCHTVKSFEIWPCNLSQIEKGQVPKIIIAFLLVINYINQITKMQHVGSNLRVGLVESCRQGMLYLGNHTCSPRELEQRAVPAYKLLLEMIINTKFKVFKGEKEPLFTFTAYI